VGRGSGATSWCWSDIGLLVECGKELIVESMNFPVGSKLMQMTGGICSGESSIASMLTSHSHRATDNAI